MLCVQVELPGVAGGAADGDAMDVDEEEEEEEEEEEGEEEDGGAAGPSSNKSGSSKKKRAGVLASMTWKMQARDVCEGGRATDTAASADGAVVGLV